jgi:hypothetical protein
MTVILHIGARKTGTSSIQRFLASEPSVLANGRILYPHTGRLAAHRGDGKFAHHDLAWSLGQPSGLWAKLRQEIDASGTDRAIISSEIFYSLDSKSIARLFHEMRTYETKVVLVTRTPFDFVVSEYKQQLKTGHTVDDFVTFAKKMLHLCDYQKIVHNWNESFGPICSLSYESLIQEGDLVSAFFKALDLEIPVSSTNCYRDNLSPTDSRAAGFRTINRVERRMGKGVARGAIHSLRNSIKRGRWKGSLIFSLARPFLSQTLYTPHEEQLVRSLVTNLPSCTHVAS